ncbi:MAG: bifunctional (p)ppGpp synthetase/guanosine-3',5'-bis(diphosphate) 3'-pyrophosphohydrolase [Anaerolineae bacterium]|nr:bifunctional (p)ppGpp synthetase/guanosine-3',5'-bis(diphosphate) 3'-pyrophosphohydrolase [Anaerolineae bacterium]
MEELKLVERDELLERVKELYPEALDEINKAIRFAAEAHAGRKRASGEPFMVHPLEVAMILTDLRMDVPTIVAGLLHDVVEDTQVSLEEIRQEFGETVARLVDGVTKLQRVERKSRLGEEEGGEEEEEAASVSEEDFLDERQAENLRKMFLAMVDDIRVVIIKLADRLHNMRTLEHLPPEKRLRKARETLDVFAPLANRLGIWQLKWQLEDLAFRHLEPERYREIARLLAERRVERAEYLKRVIAVLERRLKEEGIQARITGRPKHIYSIYQKMRTKSRDFSEIYDVHGVRIIVQEVRECYQVLGIVHALWKPIPGEFDDYIAMPKENLYQSLHTAVIALDGKPLEVQIRTEEMHRIAEYGIAAHWRYKEGAKRDATLEAKINWLRQATEWREEVRDARQFVNSLKTDVFPERVYVFTPKGDIIDLPKGATPVDFAYQIHSEIGHRCRGAKVDGRLVSLDYQLRTGEQVEILTAKQGGPSRDWLNPHLKYVATQRARQKIRQWFRRQEREQNIAAGKEILDHEMQRLGFDQGSYAEIAQLFKYSDVDDFLAAVGYGDISPAQIARKIDDATATGVQLKFKTIPEEAVSDIQVTGVGDLLTRLANCCNPVPGDPIVGYITRGKGITVHRADCPNILHLKDKERLIPVSWGKAQQLYPVVIRIEAFDRSGLLRDIAGVVADLGLNMSSANVSTSQDHTATIVITVGVRNVSQLADLLNKLQSVHEVLDVRRVRSA